MSVDTAIASSTSEKTTAAKYASQTRRAQEEVE